MFRLIADEEASRVGYSAWLEALTSNTEQRSPLRWWMTQERLMLRLGSRYAPGESLPRRVSLAYDGTGQSWTVEINLPAYPGNANSLSGIALDQQGNRWMLRQGFLRPNLLSFGIKGDNFKLGTGLAPVQVDVADGPTDRVWYTVALLDTSPEEIRRQTSEFVARCAEARVQFGYTTADAADTAVIRQLFASPENGNPYVIGPQPAKPAIVVEKKQGQVWEALNNELKIAEKTFLKPRHALGYEVDGIIDAEPSPLLVEIKSDLSAASIYAGVGQLLLYRQLLPSLSGHIPILLVPDKGKDTPPSPSFHVLKEAVSKLDLAIRIETYRRDPDNSNKVDFSKSFKALWAKPKS